MATQHGLVPTLTALGLLLWLRFAFTWIGIYLGLLLKTPESAVAVQVLVWPIGFLSSAFVTPETMPGWLGAIATWNPLSATAMAIRDLFGNPTWETQTWVADHSVLLAAVWPAVLTVIFLPLAYRQYRMLAR
ncbi:ABC transporter permease [Micromonospora sp. CPCC 205371]|nr:ABC transporter permease [Micromonospora sp. CPCC 205371]